MKPFALQRPESVADAAALLPDAHGRETVLLAGGQDLLTEWKQAVVAPDTVVDLKRIPDLDRLEAGPQGGLEIGALVTVAQLAEHAGVAAHHAVLSEAAAQVGSPQIREAGTVGGNLNQRPRCWYYRDAASPCLKKGGTTCYAQLGRNKYNAILGGGPSYIVHPSDLATALVALDAEVTLVSPRGERRLRLEDYYVLPGDGDVTRETVREPDEVLTQVHVPQPEAGLRSTYLKFRERGSYDWALSAVALGVWTAPDGTISKARLVLGGVAPTPWRCQSTEELLVGRRLDEETLRLAGQDALRRAEPLSDNAYKVPLTKGLLVRAAQQLTRD